LAISLLGYSVVRSLALLAFSRSLFSQTKNTIFRLHIWQHSLLTAIASQTICHKLGLDKLDDEAFIAGLMHDTGKVLMFTHSPSAYENVFKYIFEHNCKSIESETKYFGFDHCQVGLEATREWKLPARFNDYMGADLTTPQPHQLTDVVLQSLIAGHYLIKSAGIGANPINDLETKRNTLISLGLKPELSDYLLHDQFIADLKKNETYQLCATI
jgi:putative nucleotidyltransferase with HDIG domain